MADCSRNTRCNYSCCAAVSQDRAFWRGGGGQNKQPKKKKSIKRGTIKADGKCKFQLTEQRGPKWQLNSEVMSLTHTAWFSLGITRISGSKPFCHQRHILIMLSYAERRFEPAGIRFRLRQLYWSQGGQFICSLPGQYIEPRAWDYQGGNHDGDFTRDKHMIGCQRKIPHDNHSKLIELQSSLRSFVSHSSVFWSLSTSLMFYVVFVYE